MYYSHNLKTYLYLNTSQNTKNKAEIAVWASQPVENSGVTAKVTFRENEKGCKCQIPDSIRFLHGYCKVPGSLYRSSRKGLH